MLVRILSHKKASNCKVYGSYTPIYGAILDRILVLGLRRLSRHIADKCRILADCFPSWQRLPTVVDQKRLHDTSSVQNHRLYSDLIADISDMYGLLTRLIS